MAKPDTDDGWLKYAHELDAALAVADFTKGARIVLREVFSQVFGPAKLKTATLSSTEIGALSGMPKQNVGRSIKELTDASVLARLDDGTYRFNKNYESWVSWGRKSQSKGTPLLSPAEVSYCYSAPARAIAFRATKDTNLSHATVPNPVIQRDYPSTDSKSSHGITVQTNVIQPDYSQVIPRDYDLSSHGITNGAPPNNPLLGGRLKDSLSERASEKNFPVIQDDDAEPFHAEPVPVIKPEPKPIGVNSVADCERTFSVANKLFEMTSMATLCQQWLADHPARKVIAAMDDAVGKGKPTKYVQTLLDDPEYGKPKPSNGQPVVTRALPPQNVNPPAPKGPPVDPAETEAAIASLRSSRPEFRRKTGGPK